MADADLVRELKELEDAHIRLWKGYPDAIGFTRDQLSYISKLWQHMIDCKRANTALAKLTTELETQRVNADELLANLSSELETERANSAEQLAKLSSELEFVRANVAHQLAMLSSELESERANTAQQLATLSQFDRTNAAKAKFQGWLVCAIITTALIFFCAIACIRGDANSTWEPKLTIDEMQVCLQL